MMRSGIRNLCRHANYKQRFIFSENNLGENTDDIFKGMTVNIWSCTILKMGFIFLIFHSIISHIFRFLDYLLDGKKVKVLTWLQSF